MIEPLNEAKRMRSHEFNFAFVANKFAFFLILITLERKEWNSSISLNGTDFNVLKVKIVRYFVALQLMLFIKFTFRDVLFIRFRRQSSPALDLMWNKWRWRLTRTWLNWKSLEFHLISSPRDTICVQTQLELRPTQGH